MKANNPRGWLVSGIGLGTVALALFCLSAPCLADAPGPEQASSEGRNAAPDQEYEADYRESSLRVLQRLKMTPEQQADVAPILADLMSRLEEVRKERDALSERFVTAVSAGQVRRQDLEPIRDDVMKLAEGTIDDALEIVLDLADVLTPEQRIALVKYWSDSE